jgi:RNA polymerase sigma-70 factor, ECF subfamily
MRKTSERGSVVARMRPEDLHRLGDEDLMPLVSRKDPAAFEVFYDRHGGAAYSLAHRIAGNQALAEDIVQEAFLSIWRSEAGYDRTRGSVRAWALGIVRNRAIDALRREASRGPLDHDDDATLERRAAPERTEEEALRRETARTLRGVLGELPSDQSKVIELAYYGGFTHSEIAEMLGMPLGTVKGRMRLGLEKIRTRLAEGFADGLAEGVT